MLIIISDIHLMDGTCGKSIQVSAFSLFSDRLKELAMNASWRVDGSYRPIKQIDILLMGDILDPLHSILWLNPNLGRQSMYVPGRIPAPRNTPARLRPSQRTSCKRMPVHSPS